MRTAPPTSTRGYSRPDLSAYPPYHTDNNSAENLPNPFSNPPQQNNQTNTGGDGGGTDYYAAAAAAGLQRGYSQQDPPRPSRSGSTNTRQQPPTRSLSRGGTTWVDDQLYNGPR